MKIIIILLILTTGIFPQSVDDLNWLIGEWVNFTPEDSSYEVWEKGEEGTLNGYGMTIIKGDTVFFEELRIIEKDDTVYYQAKIEGQNNGQAVLFRFSYSKPDYIFLNREHDFPQKIVYTPVDDTLKIKLEGVEETYEKLVDLIFVRRR